MIGSGKRQVPRRTMLYAVHGWGKSTFAASMPGSIFVPTEDGLADIDCAAFFKDRVPPRATGYQEFLGCLGWLYTNEHSFKNVVVDTVDWLERLIWAEVATKRNVSDINDIDYGKGYEFAVKQWREVLTGLDMLRNERGMSVTLLAHCKVEKFANPETATYDRYSPRLHKSASHIVQEWCDEVLFGTYKVYTTTKDEGFNKERVQGIGSGERVIRTCELPAHLAKNRLRMPVEIPGTYEAYSRYLAA